jgi:hypothetical protein
MSANAASAGSSPTVDPIDALDLSGITGVPDDAPDLIEHTIPDGARLETPPAPTPDANAPAAAAATRKAGADRGDGRDDKGHFASKEELERAARGEEASGKPAATAETPAADTPATDPAADAPVPFRYRAMGGTHELEGATVDPTSGNIVIPKTQEGTLREALNALKVRDVQMIPSFERLQRENEGFKAKVQQLESSVGERETTAGQMMDHLTALFNEPDENKAAQLFFKMRDDFPRLQLEAKAKYWQDVAKRGGQGPDGTPAAAPAKASTDTTRPTSAPETYRATADDGRSFTKNFIEDHKVNVEYRDLTPKDWQQYEESLGNTPYAFVRPATADDAKQHDGVVVGQDVFDTDIATNHFQRFVTSLREARAAVASTKKVAMQNARTTQPTIDAPPTVTTDAPRAKPAGGQRPFTNREEYEAYMNSSEL